jgi:prepilin-type N-terminal cleavage/methylation domain-containing protein
MSSRRATARGFTLIELTITLSVALTFCLMAIPSFASLRQRAAVRGAADELLAFWNEARFEAVKRNQLVKVGVFPVAGGGFCLGAATTTSEADSTPCDCSSAAPASNACDVGRYPASQSEWNRVTLAGVSLGGTSSIAAPKPVVIEPKRTTLTEPGDKGAITLASPNGGPGYRLNLRVDQLGRGLLCESLSATGRLPDYASRRCSDT